MDCASSPRPEFFLRALALALRIGFSNALFPSPWHPGTRQNTTPGALETIQTYFDGLYEGDADKLASIFHETSALTYEQDGQLVVLPLAQWLKAVRG